MDSHLYPKRAHLPHPARWVLSSDLHSQRPLLAFIVRGAVQTSGHPADEDHELDVKAPSWVVVPLSPSPRLSWGACRSGGGEGALLPPHRARGWCLSKSRGQARWLFCPGPPAASCRSGLTGPRRGGRDTKQTLRDNGSVPVEQRRWLSVLRFPNRWCRLADVLWCWVFRQRLSECLR